MPLSMLTLRQAAARIGIAFGSLERLIRYGDGPPIIQISKRRVGVLESDLEAWLCSRRRPQTAQMRRRPGWPPASADIIPRRRGSPPGSENRLPAAETARQTEDAAVVKEKPPTR